MADQFREVTTTSYGKRIMGSLMGVIFGLLFFIGAFPLIFWNEGRSIDRIRTLDEGRKLVVEATSTQLDSTNNGRLIHLSGKAVTNDILRDPIFGVQENALKLSRIVEMYQWKESKHSTTEKNMGGSEAASRGCMAKH